ncbi:MAG: cation:proton antiporter [Paludibacteraceae bacterium]|nr:cation:proton antiporter [Paludibacteraceae bacterium]
MDTFTQLSIIIVLTTLIAGLMRILKQPLVVGYILTGVLIGPLVSGFVNPDHTEVIEVFSEMGVASLLFIVGLHLSPNEAKQFGKTAFIIGLLQVILTFSIGFLISTLFKFTYIASIYIGIALSFSSTIVVLKFLSDKRDLDALYGRISIGVLLLQDIVAALVLIGAATFSSGENGFATFSLLILKGFLVFLTLFFISHKLLPKLATFFAASQEFLFLFAISWGFGLSALFANIGFSLEIGALIAGVILSVSPYSEEISSRFKPLRDFFVVMFFVLLGTRVSFESTRVIIIPALVFSFFTLFLKPLIIMSLLGAFKYKRKPGFYVGTHLAQISEFSLILALFGLASGHINEQVFALITVTGIITITISTYLINYTAHIYQKISKYLQIFERKDLVQNDVTSSKYEVILFGCNRVGYDFVEVFKELDTRFLAVDFDPDIVKELKTQGINIKYGDADDLEFLEEIKIYDADAIISTIPDFETNVVLLKKARSSNKNVIVILTSHETGHAIDLYEMGANYVIVPHFLGGQVVSRLAYDAAFGLQDLEETRAKHLDYLLKRNKLGHAPAFR